MLTITAYSDIPADIIVSEPEPLLINESGEDEEQSDFAEILAGLINVQSAQTPESAVDALSNEKIKEGNELDIFSNEIDKNSAFNLLADLNAERVDSQDSPQAEAVSQDIDAIIDDDYQNIIDTDQITYGDLEIDGSSGEILYSPDQGSDVPVLNDSALNANPPDDDVSAEIKLSAESGSSFVSEKIKTDPAAQLNAASDIAEAAPDKKTSAKDSASQAESAVFKNEKASAAVSGKSSEDTQRADVNQKQNDTPGKLDEHRSRIRKDKVSFEVRDFRTGANTPANEHASALGDTVRAPGKAAQEVTLDLRIGDQPAAQTQAQTTWETRSSAALENMLARELHQNFNGDIVRHASMILRNGGEGIIKLALHPQTLGNVKIHLEMAENKITGHIFVESQESMNAFRREIASLEQAFRDSGFAEATLDLSLSGSGAENQEHEAPSYFAMNAAANYEDSYDAPIVDVFFGRRDGSVNMLA